MMHQYELRKLENNGTATTVEEFIKEPKDAKRKAKAYAKKNPGLYTLYKVDTIEIYFTEKEL